MELSPELQKFLISKSYDAYALTYTERNEMQSRNLVNLLEYAKLNEVQTLGAILDVGCGFGSAGRLLQSTDSSPASYVGIDLSMSMLAQASLTLPPTSALLQADAEYLPFVDSHFDLILSNSVYHWLNVPEIGLTPQRAWRETYRVLKDGGYVLLSIAGQGTASVFQSCYHRITNHFRASGGFNEQLHRTDPIGCMTLEEVRRGLTNCGYYLIYSTRDYEPIIFEDASKYADAVEAYGYEMYLEAFADNVKQTAWRQLRDNFVTMIGPGAYVHDQFMIYVIARKKGSQV